MNEEIEAMGRAMAAAEQAGASEDLLVEARSMLADMASAAGSQRDVEVVPAPPMAEAARAPGTRLGFPGAVCKESAPSSSAFGVVDTHCCTVGLHCHRACSVGSSPSGLWGRAGPG